MKPVQQEKWGQPLISNQNSGSFSVNGGNTTFTVPVTGLYYLTYQINTTAGLLCWFEVDSKCCYTCSQLHNITSSRDF
ncbi:hypothetical protein ACIQW7_04730 [Peribacillus simplex]|uniref:BclA C-terminal domain-containing protein n=1 Tax=Peribacillus simplex TaxID=1478 RepID=UPI003801E34D